MIDAVETNRAEIPKVRPEPAEAAAERSAFAVHRDPSLTTSGGDHSARVGRGIAWVRPTDLITSSTARIAGRGISFQAELAHRARRAPGQAYRATRNGVRDIRDRRAQRTTPEETSVFEPQNRNHSSSWVRPSGIGQG
jgi:hypothetical protein